MSPYRRNVLVGATMLFAMLVLAWMIFQFAGQAMAPFRPARIPIHFICDRADGLGEGANITYLGVSVGQVTHVLRTDDDTKVRIEAEVDAKPKPLPANVKGLIRSTGLIGAGSYLQIAVKQGEAPQGQLASDTELQASYVGLEFLPPEFAQLATDLRETSRQFRESNLVVHIDEQVQHIGKLIDSVQAVIDDPKTRADLQATLANLKDATAKASQIAGNLNTLTNQANTTLIKTQGHIDDLSKNVGDRLLQVASLLDQFNDVAKKIHEGKGTAGQLVNDPKLYESLVDTTRELNLTIKDLKRLVEQWEQEGVSLKMGK